MTQLRLNPQLVCTFQGCLSCTHCAKRPVCTTQNSCYMFFIWLTRCERLTFETWVSLPLHTPKMVDLNIHCRLLRPFEIKFHIFWQERFWQRNINKCFPLGIKRNSKYYCKQVKIMLFLRWLIYLWNNVA